MAEQLCPNEIAIAYSPDEVERIHRTGKLVTVIGIENGYVIGNDLSLIRKYYDLGGRYLTLAHTTHNDIADSSNPQAPEHNGLSAFGETVVAEMNRVGMMVDLSHISKAAMLHAIKVSKAPVAVAARAPAAGVPVAREAAAAACRTCRPSAAPSTSASWLRSRRNGRAPTCRTSSITSITPSN